MLIFVETFAQTILSIFGSRRPSYPTVIGGHSTGLGVFPVPLREFLMAGGAEFGKMAAAGPAAGVEVLRQRGPPIGRKNDGSKTSRSHPGSRDSSGPAGPAAHRLQRDRAARLGGKAGARGAQAAGEARRDA